MESVYQRRGTYHRVYPASWGLAEAGRHFKNDVVGVQLRKNIGRPALSIAS